MTEHFVPRTPDHRLALEGDSSAQRRERDRIEANTVTHDMRSADREQGSKCSKRDLHDPHDHDEIVWGEPQWVNPRTKWKRHCVGVRDESPYPVSLSASERGVWLTKQDTVRGDDLFPIVRRMILSDYVYAGDAVAHLGVEIWTKPVREYPPMHVGDKATGILLDKEQATAVRDFLTSVLDRVEAEEAEES